MKFISVFVNNPEFIEMQIKTLNKFVKGGNFEYIDFNDGKDWPDITNFNNPLNGKIAIRKKCEELSIKCIELNTPKEFTLNNISARHVICLNTILEFMKSNPDEYLLLDSDMFLISELDLNRYRKYISAFVVQDRPNLKYMWGNFFYINTLKIQNIDVLDFSIVPGGDSGSASYKWLKTFNTNIPSGEEIRYSKKQLVDNYFYYIKHLWSCSWDSSEIPECIKNNNLLTTFLHNDSRNNRGKYFCEIYDNIFFHYRGGSNWMNNLNNNHNLYMQQLLTIVDSLCKN